MELSGSHWRPCIRLASTNADRVLALSNDWISILGHHAQVTVLQLKVNLLAFARFEMNPLKSAERDLRGALHRGKLEIDLDDLISRNLSRICHRDIRVDWLSRGYSLRRDNEIAVAECCVAESVAEWIEWLAAKVPVGPVGHPIVLKVGQLAYSGVERDRQLSRRIVFTAQRLSDRRSAFFPWVPSFENRIGVRVEPVRCSRASSTDD